MAGGTLGGSGGRRAPIVGINVTPMVDVVLVLLVIMMVSATYIVAQSLKVELPKTATSDESPAETATVTLLRSGELLFDDRKVSEADLVTLVRSAQARNVSAGRDGVS